MPDHTLLVIADPADPLMAMLDRLSGSTRVVCGNAAEAFHERAAEADILFNWSGNRQLLEQVWTMASGVRWVHSRSAGLDDVLFPALVESDVPLTNARGVFSRPLGEFVMAAILFFSKDLQRMVRSQTAGVWDQFDIEEIHGRTMAVVGFGDIGRTCARLGRAFGMKVTALRRRPELCREDPLVDDVFPPEAIRELLAAADYVVVSVPLTAETRWMIGEEELRTMKKSAVLINVGRGPVVQEAALVRALEEKWIRGAALDVFDSEPLPEGHPFYSLENLLLSPHCADHTPDWQERAMLLFLENYERFRRGEPLLNLVDKRAGY